MGRKLISFILALLICVNIMPAGVNAGDGDAPGAGTGNVPDTGTSGAGNTSVIKNGGEDISVGDAKAGSYVIHFYPLGEGAADYYDMVATVWDADGNSIGRFPMGAYGLDLWEPKKVDAFFDVDPATIKIKCMYKPEGAETYEEITFEHDFEEFCYDRIASGELHVVQNETVDFCKYTIECVKHDDGTLPGVLYVDADGNPHYQPKCYGLSNHGFTNILTDSNEEYENDGWYSLRADYTGENGYNVPIYVNGDVNLVLCDGSALESSTFMLMDGSSLTIWQQREGTGKLTIVGEKVTGIGTSNQYYPGIQVETGSSLTINGGIIDVTGQDYCAGIGGRYEHGSGAITINAGTVTVKGGTTHNSTSWTGGAAIGGGGHGSNGPIVINGGTVTAKPGALSYGAAIGSGDEADGGPITINGGTVITDATIGAGSHSKSGAVTINGGTVEVDSKSIGIGGSTNGPITITGGTVRVYTTYVRTAIGASGSQEDPIIISGGTVIAKCSSSAGEYSGQAAAIGGGGGGHAGSAGVIIISGKDTNVIAISEDGAGIGSGGVGRDMNGQLMGDPAESAGDITIEDGFVFAMSTKSGAGIGGGNGCNGGKVTINGGYVIAYGGSSAYNWYTDGAQDTAGSGTPGASDDPINAYMESFLYDLIADAILDLIFSNTYSAAGIGGGSGGTGGTVNVNGGIVVARGGTNECSAIGWGKDASTVALSIYNGAKVTYGHWNDGNDNINIDGWTTGNDKAQKARDNAYAKIEPGPLTVRFDVGAHGTPPETQVVTMGQTATRPDDPSEEGFIFGDWYKTNAFDELFDFEEPIMTNTVVYGRWLTAFDLTVKKIWPEGAEQELPASVTVNYTNKISEEKTETGALTLTAENGWTANITLSEISILTLTEEHAEGFVADGWTLTCGLESRDVTGPEGAQGGGKGTAVLNLRDASALNLSAETLAALRNGGGTVALNNKKARIYSAEKRWDIPQNNYKPATVSVVLQHKNGGTWETVETVILSEEKGWKADFSPLPETAGMDADYRVRELDQDGNPVLDAADEGGAQQPTVTFGIEPWTDTHMDMSYKVSYTDGVSGKTIIKNTAGEYYYVKIIWQSNDGVIDMPETVTVNLFKTGSFVDYLTLSAANNWEGVFQGQMDSADYRAREEDCDDKTVFVSDLDSEAFPGSDYDKAVYIVEKDGAQRIYEFDVTVEVSDRGRTTVITNTKSGVVFTAKKVWNTPDDSLWPQRIYRVSAVLQKRVTPEGEDAEPMWQDVERIDLGADIRWEGRFPSVRIGQDFDEDNYRVREFIKNVAYGYSNIKIDAGTDDPEAEGRLMLLPGDSDNTDRKPAHFSCEYRYINGSMSDYEYSSAGFTVSYERDEDGTFVIKNTQDGIVTVEKKWTDSDGKEIKDGIPESVKVVLQKKDNGEWTTVGEASVLNKENSWRKSFDLTGELDLNDISADLANYRVRELDEEGNIVYDADDSDKPEDAKGKISFKVKTGKDDETADVYFAASYKTGSAGGSYTVTNKLLGGRFVIEKEWDVDLEKTDCPDSVEAVIQAKNGDEWETVKLIELKGKEEESGNNSGDSSGNNSGDGNNSGGNSESDSENEEWKTVVYLPLTKKTDDGKTVKIEYRVRELREETALDELMGRLKDFIKQGKDKYDEWIETLKTDGSKYYNMLPDAIKEAANQGYEQLLDKLNATPNDLYDKLMEKLDEVTSGNRIVYDKDDPEVKKEDGKGGDDDDGDEDEKPETNAVRFHVKEKNSVVSGGSVDAHVTKYSVEYKEEDGTFTITNKAILDIDLIKRWLAIGVEEEDMPESAWVVLLFKPKEGAVDKAGGIASSAGVDISGVLDFEFPVINPEDGGRDPVSIISELVTGIDINIFSSLEIVPKLAIDKVDEDSNWTKTYTVSKYYCGIPMEYKGAELSSEIIRQIVKYLTDGAIDSPVSYNPFDNYFSIPTPAIRTLAGITDPGTFLDFSALTGKFLEKAKSLTMDDIRNFGPETLLDDWHLMANVINVKIDWNTDPGKAGLVISKIVEGETAGSNFIFEIEKVGGPGEEDGEENEQAEPFRKLTVIIPGSGSVKIADVAPGVYRVTEITSWSWRYDATSEVSVEVTIEGEDDVTVTFTNALNGKNWLNAETRADNFFWPQEPAG